MIDDKPPNNRQRKNREPMPKRDNDDRQQQVKNKDWSIIHRLSFIMNSFSYPKNRKIQQRNE